MVSFLTRISFAWFNVPFCDSHTVPFGEYSARVTAACMKWSRQNARAATDLVFDLFATITWPCFFFSLILPIKKMRDKNNNNLKKSSEMNKRFGWHKEHSCGAATSQNVPVWLCTHILPSLIICPVNSLNTMNILRSRQTVNLGVCISKCPCPLAWQWLAGRVCKLKSWHLPLILKQTRMEKLYCQ